jgi:hypothetical protein
MVYFYRTKEDALAVVQAAKQQAENDAKADADLKASNAEWRKKLTSLAYMVDNNDPGFKLVYGVCKPADEDARLNKCNFDGSHVTVAVYRTAGSAICRDARTPNAASTSSIPLT